MWCIAADCKTESALQTIALLDDKLADLVKWFFVINKISFWYRKIDTSKILKHRNRFYC